MWFVLGCFSYVFALRVNPTNMSGPCASAGVRVVFMWFKAAIWASGVKPFDPLALKLTTTSDADSSDAYLVFYLKIAFRWFASQILEFFTSWPKSLFKWTKWLVVVVFLFWWHSLKNNRRSEFAAPQWWTNLVQVCFWPVTTSSVRSLFYLFQVPLCFNCIVHTMQSRYLLRSIIKTRQKNVCLIWNSWLILSKYILFTQNRSTATSDAAFFKIPNLR